MTKQQAAVIDDDDDFFNSGGGEEGSFDSEVADLDLSDVDENAGGFQIVPAGVYNATLAATEYGPSQRSGKNMITWVFELAGGKGQLRYYTVTQADSGLARLKKLLVRIAPTTNMKKFNPATTPQTLIGTPCRLKVRVRMYEGEKRNDIQDVLPPAVAKAFED